MKIELDDKRLSYCGRIDRRDPGKPEFIFPASSLSFRFYGKKAGILLENKQAYWDNYLGGVIDGIQVKWKLNAGGTTKVSILDEEEEKEHRVTVFKRQDGCHEFILHELDLEGSLLEPDEPPYRKMEVYGDSISAGEVSEAVEYTGMPDPPHQGEYSNSWYSYPWIAARKLNAQLSDIAQGGIALQDQTGWFLPPDYPGMESVWDKLHYHPGLGPEAEWDFSLYTPQAVFRYINGGIGGTCSCFGAARAGEDLLRYRPDFAVVDFSVNDEPDDFHRETFEGLLRKLMNWPSHPGILVLHNVYYDSGKSAQDIHGLAAARCHIPCVSIRDTVYRRMREGEYRRDELTPDGLHPNDLGHRLVAAEIIGYLEQVKEKVSKGMFQDGEAEDILPPVTKNRYEQAVRLTTLNSTPVLSGFRADWEEKKGHLDIFKNGWTGRKKGDAICFQAECSCLAVQYRKTIKGRSATARLVLDGNQEDAVVLDGNFDERWGDCLYLQPILSDGEKKVHRIEIQIKEDSPDVPFYLASLIIS